MINARVAREKLSSGAYFITPFLIGEGHYTDRKISFCVISPIGSLDYDIISFDYPKLPNNREQLVFTNLSGGIIFSSAARYFYGCGIDVYDSLLYRWYHLDRNIDTDSYGVDIQDGQKMPMSIGVDIHFKEKSQFESVYIKYGLSQSFLAYFKGIYQEILSIEYNGICYRKSLVLGSETGEILKGYHSFTTRTGRISYKTGTGMNLLSLPKNEEREKVVSRYGANGTLAEFDFDGFHIRILAKILGFHDIAKYGRAHDYFAKQYFGDVDIDSEMYELAKKMTFHELYGDAGNEYNISFFREVNNLRDDLWKKYRETGNIQTVSGRYIADPNEKIESAGKLLSYYIQALEVETATAVLQKINDILVALPAHIVLYTYDSFLFDFNNVTPKYLVKIFNVFNELGYPTKVKMGRDYFNMIDVTDKVRNYANKD